MHDISSIKAFGGIGISCFLSLFPVLKKMIGNAGWPKPWQVLVVYGQLFAVIIITLILAGIPVFQELHADPFNPEIPPVFWVPCE